MDFYEYVVDTYDDMNYIEVMRAYSSHFERLTRGNHHKWEQGRLSVSKGRKSVSVTSPDTLSDTPASNNTLFFDRYIGSRRHAPRVPKCDPETGEVIEKKES